MRKLIFALLLSTASAALANPTPDLVPAPSWVKRVPLKVPADSTEAPVRVLLSDQQISLTPGSIARYTETAVLIQNANGLAAGNLNLAWRPDIDTLAVHTLTLTRKGKVVDVLAKQKFTVIRRETNLEEAALDGRLTATLIVEGVEVGDVLTLATTVTSRDPTWGSHVENVLAQWNGVPIEQAHSRLHWTRDIPLRLQTSAGFPAFTTATDATGKYIEVSADHVQPLIPPKGAPLRFQLGRYIEATDYHNWGELSARFEPLFAKASTIDPKGALAQRIDAIRADSADPLARATAALALVQDNVRYVALFMGEGGYVPAQADATWANRLGDCKAKTALLLAMLHRLDIPAVAVLVGARAGDGTGERLPTIGAFDHVLVRATIKGRDYWLDGTRTGDRDLARIETPNFHWGLPLTPAAQLVRMVPELHADPDTEFALKIDARDGIYAPAKAHAEVVYRRDAAQRIKLGLAGISDANRENALNEFWRSIYEFIEPTKVSAAFDPSTGTERLMLDGNAKLKLNDSWLRVPGSGLAYTADFARPAGPGQDAPFATSYPNFDRATTTIQLPPGVTLWPGKVGHNVDQTLAGVAYHREALLNGNTLHMTKSERTILPEVDAATARSAQSKIRALDDEDVQLQTDNYGGTDADLTALAATKPDTASDLMTRGLLRVDKARYREAIADFTAAHELDPKDEWSLANRGLAHAWLDEPEAAEADFAAVTAMDPKNVVVPRGRAIIAEQRGDMKTAVAQLTASLAIDPDNRFALRHRLQANQALGNYDAAIADVDALLRSAPRDVELRLLRANIFKSQGNTARLIAEAEAIQRENPTDTNAQVTAAKVFAAAGRRDRAMSAYELALAIKPESFVYINREQTRERSDLAARRSDLEAARKLDPKDESTLFASAALYEEQQDFTHALADYTAALAAEPKGAYILAARGIAYARMGDQLAAKRDFDAAVALESTPSLFNALCWGKATHKVALASALADCNRAVAGLPNSPAILDSRGLVNLRLGKLDAALADYDAALKQAPRQTSSLYGRALVHAARGEAAAAVADRKAAEALEPEVIERFRSFGLEPPAVSGSTKTASATH